MPPVRNPLATMAPPLLSPSSSSPAGIIEGMKQGNALELQLVKQMQDGLNAIADGMRKQCHDRSDACDELREGLEAMDVDFTTSHKDKMKKLIEDGADVCEKLKQQARDTCHSAGEKAYEEYYAIQDKRDARRDRLEAQVASSRKLSVILGNLCYSSPHDAVTSGKWNESIEEWNAGTQLMNQDILEFNAENEELWTKIQEEKEREEKRMTETHSIVGEFEKVLAEISRVLRYGNNEE